MASAMLLLLLACLVGSGICMPRLSSYDLDQEPPTIFSPDEVPSGEIEEYQPRMNPRDEDQKIASLYQLLRKYYMEARKSNVLGEGYEKIKRNNYSRRMMHQPWMKN